MLFEPANLSDQKAKIIVVGVGVDSVLAVFVLVLVKVEQYS